MVSSCKFRLSVNTTNDDVFFVPASNGVNAYFSYYDPTTHRAWVTYTKWNLHFNPSRKFTIRGNAMVTD
jgi:hypothetical protein